MIIYFQSAGLMHSCYSYISLAIASAFRMGLHRCAVLKFFDPIQQETRKRAFWVLQTMDTYVATMLGLPKNIRDEDLDQDFPLDVDDEFVTEGGVLPVPAGYLSNMAVVNAHTKLLLIMANVITYIYPNQKDLSREYASYHVDHVRIVKVEANLEEWFRNVVQPPALDDLVSPEALRSVSRLQDCLSSNPFSIEFNFSCDSHMLTSKWYYTGRLYNILYGSRRTRRPI